MRRELLSVLQANTGSYRQREEERPKPTYGQEQLATQQEAILTKGAINRYYNNLDKWHRETVRRILDPLQSDDVPGGEEALAFRNHCFARGIPEEVLDFKNIKCVIATRSLGYGSPQLRDITTQELVKLIPYMDEVSRNHALRARAASLPGIGMRSVDSFFPPIEKSGVPNAHAALAVLENNALRQQGGKALVEPMQNHSIHFDTHMKDALQHAQDPQAHPVEKLVHMENAGPHLTQHLQNLKGDPTRKQEVKDKQKQLDQLGKMSDQLHQQVTEAMQAQSPNGQQQPPDPEMASKMAKVTGELGLKAQKQKGEFALKERKQAHNEMLQDKKTAAGIRRETAKSRVAMNRPPPRT